MSAEIELVFSVGRLANLAATRRTVSQDKGLNPPRAAEAVSPRVVSGSAAAALQSAEAFAARVGSADFLGALAFRVVLPW
jgi:hypothetical protein